MCPGCQEELLYDNLFEHVDKCKEAIEQEKNGSNAGQSNVHKVIERRNTMAKKFQDQLEGTQVKLEGFPNCLYVLHKDSRTISIFNPIEMKLTSSKISHKDRTLPHNF